MNNYLPKKSVCLKCRKKKYTFNDILDYAIKIRKWLDKYGKKGNILKQLDKKLWKKEANLKYKRSRPCANL